MKKSQKYKPIQKEDYELLLKNATGTNSTKRDRLLLWFWFNRYGDPEDFDGEGYQISFSRRIYPAYQMIKDFDGDVIGRIITDAVIM